jgi:hypothetical protein
MVSEMIKSVINKTDPDNNPWTTTPMSYFYLIGVISLCSMQLSFINRGLAQFDAVSYLPMYYALLILMGTLCGSTFYQEFANFAAYQYVLFPCGTMLTMLGVTMLCYRESPPKFCCPEVCA